MADEKSYIQDAELYQDVLNRMNITWEPDEKTVKNIRNAIIEAEDLLRNHAGSRDITFYEGELRSLLIICAWYLVENKKADFEQEYSGDLINLRLREGFGCGKETVDTI